MIKQIILLVFLSFSLQSLCIAQQRHFKKDPQLLRIIQQNFKDAAAQYKVLASHLPAGVFPKTYFPETGKYEFSKSSWWCSGFYPGSLLKIYAQTGDTVLYLEALRMLALLQKEQYNTGTHDLGFMMNCSFGTANQLQPSTTYGSILLNSAKSLSTRFDPAVGCIRSWNGKPGEFLVIIDNMMNLKLLLDETTATGDSSFYQIAITHANTTLRNHFRPDHSSYHVVNYHPGDGAVQQKITAQGAADTSAWARGQAWGLYGFTEVYGVTKDNRYLEQANKIAGFILNDPNLPADKIPYWDFDAPGIPDALRDASAAAIMASAFLQLSQFAAEPLAKTYFKTAETILRVLSSPAYKATAGTNGGFILKHGVGHMPAKTEIDVPLTYGDYYFIEAMERYKNMGR